MLRQLRDLRVALFVILVVVVALAIWGLEAVIQPPRPGHKPPQFGVAAFNPPYAGVDYYYPADYFGGCPNWTWLQDGCYTHNPTGGSTTEQQQLTSDAAWIARTNTGRFMRVWIMLDMGIRWDASGNYLGLDPAYLSNLDDALAKFRANGLSVDAVLLEASQGTSDKYQMQMQALDGGHPALRAGYLQALKDFATHVAGNPTDAATILVVDELNEAYFQGSRFSLSDTAIHSFLHDEYLALKSGYPSIVVTASDTTRLLKDYATWGPMYNDSVDIYDIHAYSDHPDNDAALWARAKAFTRPWMVGEAGCGVGNISCTYDSGNTQCRLPITCALSVDSWWLDTLKNDGARAVLVEARQVAWSYASGSNSQTATLVGQKIQAITQANPAPLPQSTVAPSGTASVLVSPVPATATSTSIPATSTPLPPTATSVPAHTATPVPPLAPTATATATSGHHRHRRH